MDSIMDFFRNALKSFDGIQKRLIAVVLTILSGIFGIFFSMISIDKSVVNSDILSLFNLKSSYSWSSRILDGSVSLADGLVLFKNLDETDAMLGLLTIVIALLVALIFSLKCIWDIKPKGTLAPIAIALCCLAFSHYLKSEMNSEVSRYFGSIFSTGFGMYMLLISSILAHFTWQVAYEELKASDVASIQNATKDDLKNMAQTASGHAKNIADNTKVFAQQVKIAAENTKKISQENKEHLPQEPVQQPVQPQPVVQEPVQPQPVVQEPVQPQPVVQEPVQPQPVVQEPVQPQPVVQEPVQPQPVVQEPVQPQPVVQEPVQPQPVVQEPVILQPVVQEPVQPQPVVQEPVQTQPVVQEPVQPIVVTEVQEDTTQEKKSNLFCENCGNPVESDFAFCENCGAKQ